MDVDNQAQNIAPRMFFCLREGGCRFHGRLAVMVMVDRSIDVVVDGFSVGSTDF
jgi:hypothetical protein